MLWHEEEKPILDYDPKLFMEDDIPLLTLVENSVRITKSITGFKSFCKVLKPKHTDELCIFHLLMTKKDTPPDQSPRILSINKISPSRTPDIPIPQSLWSLV